MNVLFAEYACCRGFLFPFAGMPQWGAMGRRVPAADALSAHRALDHAQRFRTIIDLHYDALVLAGLMLFADGGLR